MWSSGRTNSVTVPVSAEELAALQAIRDAHAHRDVAQTVRWLIWQAQRASTTVSHPIATQKQDRPTRHESLPLCQLVSGRADVSVRETNGWLHNQLVCNQCGTIWSPDINTLETLNCPHCHSAVK